MSLRDNVQKDRLVSADVRRDRLFEKMKHHIGRDNATTKATLFMAVYGRKALKYSELERFYLWLQLKKDMNYLRRKTHCFIVMVPKQDHYLFCVAKDKKDIEFYTTLMEGTAKKCLYMRDRCKQAVEEKFWRKL